MTSTVREPEAEVDSTLVFDPPRYRQLFERFLDDEITLLEARELAARLDRHLREVVVEGPPRDVARLRLFLKGVESWIELHEPLVGS